jgi:hypothetical protein
MGERPLPTRLRVGAKLHWGMVGCCFWSIKRVTLGMTGGLSGGQLEAPSHFPLYSGFKAAPIHESACLQI